MSIPDTISSERPSRLNKTGLLISLIHPDECLAFGDGGYPDILDIKNPAEGSLGFPDPRIIREIRERTPKDIPISVAIGDAGFDPPLYLSRALRAVSSGADIVKVGLFSFSGGDDIPQFLSFIKTGLEKEGFQTPIVAGFYADRIAGKEPVEEMEEALLFDLVNLVSTANKSGKKDKGVGFGILLDTYDKKMGKLTDIIGVNILKRFVGKCRESNIFSALAGGLSEKEAGLIKDISPDYAGFRGSITGNERELPGLNDKAVKKLIELFSE